MLLIISKKGIHLLEQICIAVFKISSPSSSNPFINSYLAMKAFMMLSAFDNLKSSIKSSKCEISVKSYALKKNQIKIICKPRGNCINVNIIKPN